MNNIVDIWTYVNPENNEPEGLYMYHPMAVLTRQDGDWMPVTRENDPNIANFSTGYRIYALDFNKGDLPTAADVPDDEDPQHPMIEAYDKGTLTEDMVKEYSNLVADEFGRNDAPEASK